MTAKIVDTFQTSKRLLLLFSLSLTFIDTWYSFFDEAAFVGKCFLLFFVLLQLFQQALECLSCMYDNEIQIAKTMIINERENRSARVIEIAQLMMTAARTAPKGKGIDVIEIVTVVGDDIQKLSEITYAQGEEIGLKFMLRDAENILLADAVVLIGTRTQVQGLNCGYCGVASCAEKLKNESMPCAINMIDLGIALGSAVATAADLRVDSRVMFSVGFAVKALNMMTECHSIYAIPISMSSKNPFFDRRPREQKPSE